MNHRIALAWVAIGAAASAAQPEPWVGRDALGHLRYRFTERGDRIMDFSSAGYGGGGVLLPKVPAVETLTPSGGDDTAAIQAAIKRVESRALQGEFRGALRLAPGTFQCSAAIQLTEGGVVLQGSGAGAGGTVIQLGGPPHLAFLLGPSDRERGPRLDLRHLPEPHAKITDPYVPSGAAGLSVEYPSGFAPGDSVLIVRPATAKWVAFMGMAGLMRNGKAEHWVSGVLSAERQIRAIQGRRLEFTVPLSDAIDAAYLDGDRAEVVKAPPNRRSARIGLENVRIVSPPQHLTLGQPAFSAVTFGRVEDGWLRNVAIQDTMETVHLSSGCRRITVENVDIDHRTAITGAALPADFSIDGSQILVVHCHARGDRVFYVATGAEAAGPNVVLNCVFEGNGSIMPHQRWATGLLVDRCKVPSGSIELKNRGQMGSGHGWTIGWGVAWNCASPTLVIQNPPGARNWAIGCVGAQTQAAMPFGKTPLLPFGTIESQGHPVQPASLYLAQLADRR